MCVNYPGAATVGLFYCQPPESPYHLDNAIQLEPSDVSSYCEHIMASARLAGRSIFQDGDYAGCIPQASRQPTIRPGPESRGEGEGEGGVEGEGGSEGEGEGEREL
jgi:hypothetical protein